MNNCQFNHLTSSHRSNCAANDPYDSDQRNATGSLLNFRVHNQYSIPPPTTRTSSVAEEEITSTSEAIELAIGRLESRRQEAVHLVKLWTGAIDRDLKAPSRAGPGVSASTSDAKGVKSGRISKISTEMGGRARLDRLQARSRIAGLVDLQEMLSTSLEKLRSAQEDTGLFALSAEWELGEDQLLLDQISSEIDSAEAQLAVFPITIKGPLGA